MLRSVMVVFGSFVAMALVVIATTALSARLLLGRGAPGAPSRLTPIYLGVTLCFAALAALLGGWLAAHFAASRRSSRLRARRIHGRDEPGLDATVDRGRPAAVVRAGAARPHAAGCDSRWPTRPTTGLNLHSDRLCTALFAGCETWSSRSSPSCCSPRRRCTPSPNGSCAEPTRRRSSPSPFPTIPRPSPRALGWRGCTAVAVVIRRPWPGSTLRTISSSGASWRRTSPRRPSSTPTRSWCGSSGAGFGPTDSRCWPCPRKCSRPLTDADVGRIIAYIRSLPPVPGFPRSITLGPMAWLGLVTSQYSPAAMLVKETDSITAAGYYPSNGEAHADGAYLARTSCSECHGATLTGGFRPGPADRGGVYAGAVRALLQDGRGAGRAGNQDDEQGSAEPIQSPDRRGGDGRLSATWWPAQPHHRTPRHRDGSFRLAPGGRCDGDSWHGASGVRRTARPSGAESWPRRSSVWWSAAAAATV